MNRIVCVGNALREEDGAGPRAHALLSARALPAGVEVVFGGLSGLDLLGTMEGARSVVFIDSVRGFGAPGTVVVLEPQRAAPPEGEPFDHASGLGYLLGVYDKVLEPPPSRVRLVGVEEPADPAAVARAVAAALAEVLEVAEVANVAPQS